MTKKDLIKWVEVQRESAVSEVEEMKRKALASCKEKIIEEIGLDEVASEIQKKFNEIDDKLRSWKAGLDPDIALSDEYYWGTMARDIRQYIGEPDSTKRNILATDLRISDSKAYQKIRKKFDKTRDNVNREYTNVIANVQALKNAKLGVEYLESLGFDLTKLKEADAKPLTTALSVPINAEYLFFGREEK